MMGAAITLALLVAAAIVLIAVLIAVLTPPFPKDGLQEFLACGKNRCPRTWCPGGAVTAADNGRRSPAKLHEPYRRPRRPHCLAAKLRAARGSPYSVRKLRSNLALGGHVEPPKPACLHDRPRRTSSLRTPWRFESSRPHHNWSRA